MEYFYKSYTFNCLDQKFLININANKSIHYYLDLYYEEIDKEFCKKTIAKEFTINIRSHININSDIVLSNRLKKNSSNEKLICNLSNNIWIEFKSQVDFPMEYNIYYKEVNNFSILNILKSLRNLVSVNHINELIIIELIRISTIYPISAYLMSKGDCILLHASSYIDYQEYLHVYQGFDGCGKSTTALNRSLKSTNNNFYSDNFLIVREDGSASSFKEKARLAKSSLKFLGNVNLKSLKTIAKKYLISLNHKRSVLDQNIFPIKTLTFLSFGDKYRRLKLNTDEYLINSQLMYNLLPEFSLYRNYYELITGNSLKVDKKIIKKILTSINGKKIFIINKKST